MHHGGGEHIAVEKSDGYIRIDPKHCCPRPDLLTRAAGSRDYILLLVVPSIRGHFSFLPGLAVAGDVGRGSGRNGG